MARKKNNSNDDHMIDISFWASHLREKIENGKDFIPLEDREIVFCLWWMLKQLEAKHPFW